MSFLVLLLVLLLEKFSTVRGWVQRDSAWLALLRRIEANAQTAASAWLPLVLFALLPALALWLLLALLAPVAYGWLALPVHLLVMLFGLGRGDVLGIMGPFRDAWRRDDSEAAYLAARRDLGIEAEEGAELLQRVQAHLVWEAYQGFFAVIFWYALLGLVPVLFYRLLALLGEHAASEASRDQARQLRHALDWLPARCLAATFGLVGHFEAVSRVLLEQLLNWELGARALPADSSRAAADIPALVSASAGIAGLDSLWQLLVRAAIAWYAIFAIWTILV
jgi:AmpE protein